MEKSKPVLTIITSTGNLNDLIFYMADHIHRRNPPHVPYEHFIIDKASPKWIRDSLDKLNDENTKVIHLDEDIGGTQAFDEASKHAQGDIIVGVDADVFIRSTEFWKFITDTLTEDPNTMLGGQTTSGWIGKYGKGKVLGGCVGAFTRKSGILPDSNFKGYAPTDIDLSLQFMEKGYKLKVIPRYFYHIGGGIAKFFYAITPEYFEKYRQYNIKYFYDKWDKKIPNLKGWL